MQDQMSWAFVVINNEDRYDLLVEGDNLLRHIVKEVAKALSAIVEGA